jgi:O-antigen ligase
LPVLLTIKKILQDPVYIVRVILISAFVLLVFVNILSVGNNLDISETFLNRVVITFKNIDNYEGLIAAEPSLATRIGLYVNYFILGLKNPILGIGYGNLTYLIDRQLALSPIPLTSELTARFTHNAQSTGGSPNIFFRFLAETGIVGIIFLYLFFFSLITAINKNLPDYSGIEKEFLTGLKYFLIALIITSIYDSTLNHPINWIIIGIIQAMITNTVEEPATRIRKINIEQLKTITEGT